MSHTGNKPHPLFPEVAHHSPIPSSPGLATQILGGTIMKKIPASAGMTALKLSGSKNPLCSPLNSVPSVVQKTATGIKKPPFMFIHVHSWWKKSKYPSTSYLRYFAQDDTDKIALSHPRSHPSESWDPFRSLLNRCQPALACAKRKEAAPPPPQFQGNKMSNSNMKGRSMR